MCHAITRDCALHALINLQHLHINVKPVDQYMQADELSIYSKIMVKSSVKNKMHNNVKVG